MSKKVLIINSSPRKASNTNTVAGWVSSEARKLGAAVDIVDVNLLKYKTSGCIACMGCQKSKKYSCSIKDGATPVLASIPDYDILILTTPVYFFGPTAQLKVFFDRAYSLFKFREDKIEHNIGHIKFGLIATAAGDMGSGLKIVESIFKMITGFAGSPLKSLLIPFAPQNAEEMSGKKDVKQTAEVFARELIKSAAEK